MKKVLQISATAVAVLSLSLGGLASAASSGTINGTGYDSTNTINVEENSNHSVTTDNTVDLTNSNDQTATTGTATVYGNISGSDATTGSASNTSEVVTGVGVASASWTSMPAASSSEFDGSIQNTGVSSVNRVNYMNSSSVTVNTTNNVTVSNTNTQTATSGNALVQNNITGGSATTGDASNTSSVATFVFVES